MIEERVLALRTRDGTIIHTHVWSNGTPQRVLVCVQGLGGHGGYYDVLARALSPEATAIVAPDLRGHGHSQGTRGDIESFAHYLEDVHSAVCWVREAWPDAPIFLLGESMGSSIAIGYVTSNQNTEQMESLAGLILVSPVLRAIVRPSLQETLRGTRALLFSPTRPMIATTGREELGCRDPDFNDRLRADPLFIRQVSIRFLYTLTSWLKQIQRKASQVTLPLLLLQGKRDYVAHPLGSTTFLQHVGSKDVEQNIFAEAYHCLLYDPDTPEVLKALSNWLGKHT